ncbi:MAG: hypothetical protein WC374_10380 [Phycisphaerae bacterium]|jgi:hypothetical protein
MNIPVQRVPVMKAAMKEAKGLYQGLDDNLINLSYSPDCQNIDVSEGIISSRKGYKPHLYNVGAVSSVKRFFRLEGWVDDSTDRSTVVVGVANTAWYSRIGVSAVVIFEPYPSGDAAMTDVDAETAMAVNYMINNEPVLIIVSTGADPYYVYYNATQSRYEAAPLSVTPPTSTDGFRFVCEHRERIWLAGGSEKNTVYYSNAYDPTDWSTAGETGSKIVQTFDSDSIRGMANLLDDVLIFKRNTIWKVVGDTPSEYSVEQVYSIRGAIYPRSICTNGDLCFFAADDGIYQYDGIQGKPILTDEIKEAFSAMTDIRCVIIGSKLYVWDIISDDTGKCIVYDLKRKTIEVLKVATSDRPVDIGSYNGILLYADALSIYEFDNTKIKFDASNIDAYWITPDTDFSHPSATKKLKDIYFNAWGTTNAGAAGGQIKITAYANKKGTVKTKEKTVTLSTARKPHRLRYTLPGRIFKFKIENVDGSAFSMTPPEFDFELAED